MYVRDSNDEFYWKNMHDNAKEEWLRQDFLMWGVFTAIWEDI
jgi:hypothetical protein